MRTILRRVFLLAIASILFVVPQSTRAQWTLNGHPVAVTTGQQVLPEVVSDGSGGVILVWQDGRNTDDIYAQRLNGAGVPQWTPGGVIVCNAAFYQIEPKVVADGVGGAVITWADLRSGALLDVYAQRLNAAGMPLWTANGVPVSAFGFDQYQPAIVADGSGGAIISWTDYRNGSNADIWAQRLNASGAPQWVVDGIAIHTAVGNQSESQVVGDGLGGAIIVFQDTWTGPDVRAQRVNAGGLLQWGMGVPICTAAGTQVGARVVPDGSGGAVIAWSDARSEGYDIYAQRVNNAGVTQWFGNGVPVVSAPNDQWRPSIAAGTGGGILLTWEDSRSGSSWDIYAQSIDGTGAAQWPLNGVPVSTANDSQVLCSATSDGAGGIVVAWSDYRGGAGADVYARRVDAFGLPLWTANGVPASTAPSSQVEPVLVGDGAGVFLSWDDDRTGTYDMFAQRLELRYGEWGHPEPAIASISDNPADQGGKLIVRWDASDRDRPSDPLVTHYSLWRSTDATAVARASSANNNEAKIVENPRAITSDFAGRAIWVDRGPATAPSYWEWIANQEAVHFAEYSHLASTRQDSVAGEPAVHYFKVVAHDPARVWESPSASGYSVDNLAPAAPLLLIAQRVGSDVHLKWNRAVAPDLRDYVVYRAVAGGVTPVPGNFLSSAEDTVLVDASAPATPLYYIVTAFDVHDNQSAPSNEANVGGATGVGNTPLPTTLTLQSNVPNPFRGETTLRVGLPVRSDVTIEVYDVAGRRVAVRNLATMAAGWREVAFDGRDDGGRALASGVYFSRVTAAGQTRTQKLVIQR